VSIPIVFLVGSDPVRSGLVPSLNRPGGHITGVSSSIFDLEPKRLGLMRELRPNAATIAVLVNPNSPNAEMQVNDIQIAARSVGQQVDILNASTIREIDAAFARLVRMRVDALLVAADPIFFNRASQLVVLARRLDSPPPGRGLLRPSRSYVYRPYIRIAIMPEAVVSYLMVSTLETCTGARRHMQIAFSGGRE
jgi:putative tryptophan/tyrosine transport system substrate-binding protein